MKFLPNYEIKDKKIIKKRQTNYLDYDFFDVKTKIGMEFLNAECSKFNKPINEIFLSLILDSEPLRIFWNDMIISTRARRDTLITRLFNKFIIRNSPQKFRFPLLKKNIFLDMWQWIECTFYEHMMKFFIFHEY